ncbi:MAG: NADPH-dependent FMN reductase [Usitatibacter sp.]
MTRKKVAVLVGSLRKESISRMLAKALMEVAPDTLEFNFVEIGALPLYNSDLDTDNPPAEWTKFREALKSSDAYLFVTPEYNRTIPGALKNAIDVGSRPGGKSSWAGGKPGAIASQSQGPISGFGANHHLRQTFVFLDIHPLQQPEVYIGNSGKLFDAAGKLTADDTREFLRKFMAAFASWVEQLAKKPT